MSQTFCADIMEFAGRARIQFAALPLGAAIAFSSAFSWPPEEVDRISSSGVEPL